MTALIVWSTALLQHFMECCRWFLARTAAAVDCMVGLQIDPTYHAMLASMQGTDTKVTMTPKCKLFVWLTLQ